MNLLGEQSTIFYIVRHGETIWNVEHRVQGHTDKPLTAKGKAQAEELATALKDIHIDTIYSSDFARAKETAEIIGQRKHINVQTTKLLRERNMGVFEGTYLGEPHLYKEFARWFTEYKDPKRFKMGVETDDEVIKRVLLFLKKAVNNHKNQTILIASHGSLLKAILVYLGFAQHEQLGHGTIKNTAYVKLTSDGDYHSIEETKGIDKK